VILIYFKNSQNTDSQSIVSALAYFLLNTFRQEIFSITDPVIVWGKLCIFSSHANYIYWWTVV